MEYTFKRLVDGLAHTRETARPGFSLALGQVSGVYPHLSLSAALPLRTHTQLQPHLFVSGLGLINTVQEFNTTFNNKNPLYLSS